MKSILPESSPEINVTKQLVEIPPGVILDKPVPTHYSLKACRSKPTGVPRFSGPIR
uniref:Uncharacterized protein n=1 Tax=mine drainage metagenome TaxID=410659 RepID=E6PXT2_9ZZZZ